MDSSSSGPDDINDRLAEIAAELAAEGKFKEPSAAERARASVQPAGGGALSRRRNKRLAAELRKPVVPSGQTAPARPPKARLPAGASARNAGTRRGRAGRWSLVILVALGLVAFGVAKLFPSGTPTKPSTASRPTPTVTPLFTTGNPFAGSPAAAYADDAAGMVLPQARPVGPYTSAQVAAGYATVKDMLVAALLNRPTMSGHKPIAFGRLLIRQQRSWFYEHLTKPIKRGKGPAWLTWRWVTAFAPGTEVVGSVVKVQGLPMTAKGGPSRRIGRSGRMSLQVSRLSLATIGAGTDEEWPVHGFLVTYPGGAVLVDTGVGGPQQVLADHRVVNRSVADALDEHDMTPGDIGLVINTHLHFDHCGQNAVFKHAPFYVQTAELARARRESPQLAGWFDFMDARFELLDGDAEILPGLSVVTTPGHTVGHQSVVVSTDNGAEVLIGDAAYKPRQYLEPDDGDLPPGQASDPAAWRESVGRVHALRPDRVHFCHDTGVIHS